MSGVEWRADQDPRPRSLYRLALLCILGVSALIALGCWQLERRSWKLDLIHSIADRMQAATIAAPRPALWPAVAAGGYTYRRVQLSGQYLNARETQVRALTRLGGGYWVLTPLRTADGLVVLINRGFVPEEKRYPSARREGLIEGDAIVEGLLRASEPKGALLHANDAAGDRWYSRDVTAIAAARRLAPIAPYFIDADATPVAGGYPVGGLTVIDLPNNHLIYALTWFALALLLAAGAAHAGREEWRRRRGSDSH